MVVWLPIFVVYSTQQSCAVPGAASLHATTPCAACRLSAVAVAPVPSVTRSNALPDRPPELPVVIPVPEAMPSRLLLVAGIACYLR